MVLSVTKKIKVLQSLEPEVLLRRLYLKFNNDWSAEDYILQRLIVNHDYHFIYCPINKNASTSMKAALLRLHEEKTGRQIDPSSQLQMRRCVDLNYGLSSYTYAAAAKILNNSNYFKFVIVRNPWARLVSTYANYFIRLPVEKGMISDIAKQASRHIYGEEQFEKYVDQITFEQFVTYVNATHDSQLDPHCASQSKFLGGLPYDYIAKMETLEQDLTYIENKLKLPIHLGSYNKTRYAEPISSGHSYCTLSPPQIRSLNHGIPSYEDFYNPSLIEIVRSRYGDDIENFNYNFN